MLRNPTPLNEDEIIDWLNSEINVTSHLSRVDEAQISDIKKFNADSDEFKAELFAIEKILTCPVSKKLLKDPVIATCGHIFSSASTAGLQKCPVEDCDLDLVVQSLRVLGEVLDCLKADKSNESKDEASEFNLLQSYKELVKDNKKISRMIDILTCPVTQCVFYSAVLLTGCGHVVEQDSLGSIITFKNECPSCRNEIIESNYTHLPVITLIARSLAIFCSDILDDQYLTVDVLIRAFMEKNLVDIKYLIQCFYERPPIFNNISASIISKQNSMLFMFSMNYLGLRLLESNKNLVAIISSSTFNSIINDNSVLHGMSPLSVFCKYAEGRSILRNDKQLRDKIDVATFYTVDPNVGLSPCTYLITNNCMDIFADDQRLVEGMTSERLNFCNPVQPLKNISLFFWLSLREMGIQLLRKYPDAAKNISSESLCSPVETPTQTDYNASALMHIVTAAEGVGVQLLAENDDLRNKITRESFSFIVPSGPYKGLTLLSYFARYVFGINILIKDQRLRSFISEEMLSSNGLTPATPVLYNLLIRAEGIKLFEIDPALCDKISVQALNAIFKRPAIAINASPATWLLTKPDGCMILAKYPQLCDKILPETLLATISTKLGFPLLIMVCDARGFALIKSSSIIRSKITAKALVTHHTYPNFVTISPIEYLLKSIEGCELIQILISENQTLHDELKELVSPQTRVKLEFVGTLFEDDNEEMKPEAKEQEVKPQETQAVLLQKIHSILTRYNLPDASTANLHKALRRAAVADNADDITFLVNEKGCDVNAQDDNPHSLKTALHWAVIKKSCKAIKAILDVRGRVDIQDFHGRTARSLAMEKNDPEITSLLTGNRPDIPSGMLSSLRF